VSILELVGLRRRGSDTPHKAIFDLFWLDLRNDLRNFALHAQQRGLATQAIHEIVFSALMVRDPVLLRALRRFALSWRARVVMTGSVKAQAVAASAVSCRSRWCPPWQPCPPRPPRALRRRPAAAMHWPAVPLGPPSLADERTGSGPKAARRS